MREMILNHASLVSPDRQTVIDWLRDAAVGMSILVRERVTERSLRMRKAPCEVACLSGWSLYDAYEELRRSGARDEYGFLVRLSSKVPLLNDMAPEVVDRFYGCQAKTLPNPDGEPLVLCAITDSISVGFPSEPAWDRDQLTVEFGELLPDSGIGHASESIDNLTPFSYTPNQSATAIGQAFARLRTRLPLGTIDSFYSRTSSLLQESKTIYRT